MENLSNLASNNHNKVTMITIPEIALAVSYIIGPLYSNLPRRRVDDFATELEKQLRQKISPYWDPSQPYLGMHQRCLRVTGAHCDPFIVQASKIAGLASDEVLNLLPKQIKIWIDPGEVSYQIGDRLSEIKYLLRRNGSTGENLGQTRNGHGVQSRFTVSSFARTKFGSTKLKSNNELNGTPRPCTLGLTTTTTNRAVSPSDSSGPLNIPCCLPWSLNDQSTLLTINIPGLKPPQTRHGSSECGSVNSELNSPVYGY